jgi:hypothetical protein
VIAQSGFHSWRNFQRLVNPAEVLKHVMQGDRVRVIFYLLAESVG